MIRVRVCSLSIAGVEGGSGRTGAFARNPSSLGS